VLVAINGTPVALPLEVAILARSVQRRWGIEVLRGGRPLLLRFRL